MEATYILIYRVRGIIGLPQDTPVQLLASTATRAVAHLTMSRDPYFLHLRRTHAFSLMISQTLMDGNRSLEGASTRFTEALAKYSIPEGMDFDRPILIVQVSGDAELSHPDRIVDVGEVSIGLGLFETHDLSQRAEAVLEATVAGISLSLPPSTTPVVTRIGHIAYVTDADCGRLFYTLDMSVSASHSSMASVSDKILEDAAHMSEVLFKKNELKTVSHLLSRSLKTTDDFQAFLTAWAGLEILVTKSFKSSYEAGLYKTLENTKISKQFLSRVRDVMKDKYNIRDKFIIVSSSLDPINAEKDIQDFRDIKLKRDGIHEMKLEEAGYPTRRVQKLLQKYLRLHLMTLR